MATDSLDEAEAYCLHAIQQAVTQRNRAGDLAIAVARDLGRNQAVREVLRLLQRQHELSAFALHGDAIAAINKWLESGDAVRAFQDLDAGATQATAVVG